MAATESCRVALVLLCILPVLFGQEYSLPDVTIRPLKPSGLMVSMQGIPLMNFFEFQANVNKKLEFGDTGDITIEVPKAKNGVWTGQDESVVLNVGDVIYYYVHIGVRRQRGYDKKDLSFTVTKLYDPEEHTQTATTADSGLDSRASLVATTARPATCRKTPTVIKTMVGQSKTICGGQIIFEDDFDTLRDDFWTVEHYIPSGPEYPFVTYQRTAVSVVNGMLRIEPQLLETLPNFNNDTVLYGELDFSKTGCTRRNACLYKSSGAAILQPIVSGRITSNTFAFKYGFVEVRAKIPQGDWLYPDILLEAIAKSYCSGDDRTFRIAGARGNLMLTKGAEQFGNKVLYGGPLMDAKCRYNLLAKKISTTDWGNDFHIYSISWEPDMITLFVDKEEWGRVKLTAPDLLSLLSKETVTCDSLRTSLQTCTSPFDEFFGITLGVSAGGILEFPDGAISGTTAKPWKNMENKARLKFYDATNTWLRTWTQKEMLVDYIRVHAL